MKNEYVLPEVYVQLAHGSCGIRSDEPINSDKKAVDAVERKFGKMDREYAIAIHLDVKCRPIAYNIVSIGEIGFTVCSAGTVYKAALLSNAHRIIVVHNHPSGDASPSNVDCELTEKLRQAGILLNVPLLDHIIVTPNGERYSFHKAGYC